VATAADDGFWRAGRDTRCGRAKGHPRWTRRTPSRPRARLRDAPGSEFFTSQPATTTGRKSPGNGAESASLRGRDLRSGARQQRAAAEQLAIAQSCDQWGNNPPTQRGLLSALTPHPDPSLASQGKAPRASSPSRRIPSRSSSPPRRRASTVSSFAPSPFDKKNQSSAVTRVTTRVTLARAPATSTDRVHVSPLRDGDSFPVLPRLVAAPPPPRFARARVRP
jgi:hypothetical protein